MTLRAPYSHAQSCARSNESQRISMSLAYRAHPLAQAIEEAARIFGPEVTAAALLAAVEAATVRSTTPVAQLPSQAVDDAGHHRLRRARRRGRLRRRPRVPGPRRVAERARQCSPIKRSPGVAGRARDCGCPPAAPEPERVIEADVAPPTTTTLATAEPTGQSTSTLKERRKASRERASRDDRRNAPRRVGFTDANAAQTTKTKKATTVAQSQNTPAPAKDPNCKVLLPDNVFMSHHDQFRCFR